MGDQGWIKLHRKIQDHWIWQEKRKFSKAEAWIDLLMMVNHEDKKVPLGNELILVKRGQRITSIRQLCDRWGWSNTKVTQFLKMMQTDGMVTVKSDTKKTVITIENYDVYQSRKDEKTTENSHEDDTKQTQKHTNKNDKNDKELNTSRRKQREYEENSPYMKMAKYFLQKIREWKPDYVFRGNMHTWADHFRKIHELDKRSKEDIKAVIDWATQDDFWQANILSPAKLRKQFDTLQARMNQKRNREQGSKVVPMRQYQQEPARPNVIPNNTEDILAKYEAALRESQKRAQKG